MSEPTPPNDPPPLDRDLEAVPAPPELDADRRRRSLVWLAWVLGLGVLSVIVPSLISNLGGNSTGWLYAGVACWIAMTAGLIRFLVKPPLPRTGVEKTGLDYVVLIVAILGLGHFVLSATAVAFFGACLATFALGGGNQASIILAMVLSVLAGIATFVGGVYLIVWVFTRRRG